MKRFCRYLGLLKRDQEGGILVLVAVLLAVLLGMTALVVDVGGLYVARRQMVNCADAAALAGVMENNQTQARRSAEAYAVKNGAENFNKSSDVVIDSNGIVTVRVSREVEFTFARVLGFSSSTVGAVASAQMGPGNGLVPFAKIGYKCECAEECAEGCTENCTEPCGEICEDSVFYEGAYYVVRNEDGSCAKPGDIIQLKYADWKESEFSAGNFGYVRLPGQSGGNDLRNDLAGGYEGELESIKPGTVIREEGGQSIGPLVQGLEERINMSGSCPGYDPQHPYACDLVVIIPLVHPDWLTGESLPNKHVKIVGYVSFFLLIDHVNNEKVVWAELIEYLEYGQLLGILGSKTEGFTYRLVKVPAGVFL